MKKDVFISHSKNDKVIADIICEALESSQIGCWIAPRDIPYGNDWAGEITDAIESSKLFLFLLSESSNASRQCPKEISIADNAGIPIICIKTENVEMSSGLKYHLSMKQIMQLDVMSVDAQVEGLVSTIKSKLFAEDNICEPTNKPTEGISLHGGVSSFTDTNESNDTYNIDKELEERFNQLFGDGAVHEETKSEIQAKLNKMDAERFFTSFQEKTPKLIRSKKIIDDSWIKDYERPSLILDKNQDYSVGKHFSIPILDGIKTIVFQIREDQIDCATETLYNTVQWLDCVEDENESIMTVYLDTVPFKGAALLFLHINYNKSKIYINTGLLENDTVILCKNPEIFSFQKMCVKSNGLSLSSAAYDGNSVDFEFDEDVVQQERWVDADIDLTPPIIVDVQTGKPVLREIYYDDSDGKKKARLKIIPHRNYFAFNLNLDNSNSASRPLTALEKGRCYRNGSDGFPKDLIVAADCFEQDGSAEAMYEAALIFNREGDYRDDDLYIDYLIRSVDMHFDKAAVELAIGVLSKKIRAKTLDECVLILNACASDDSPIISFVLGYILESINKQESFECYYLAAKNGFLPAIARLQCPSQMVNDDTKELLFNVFSKTNEKAISEYCMGCVCYFGIGIESQKEYGLELLKSAADAGDVYSQIALFEIFDKNEEKNKALELLELLVEEDPSYIVKLSNRYLDGNGCEISEENDRKAFDLLKRLEKSDNEVAINNLAWMYKTGRGCEIDYSKARTLFEKSAELGSATSYRHLGDIYLEGLGVDVNKTTAIQYYQTAAKMGNEKAKAKLDELGGEV